MLQSKIKQRGRRKKGQTGHRMAHQDGITVSHLEHFLIPDVFDFASALTALLLALGTHLYLALLTKPSPC